MNFEKVKNLFDQLVELEPGARSEQLDKAKIGEHTRNALRRLFELDGVLADDPDQLLQAHPEAVPTQIGPFAIDGVIGEGGMGRVYRAHREVSGVRQALAIKVVRRDRLDAATRARFNLERQVLALLKHPNIGAMVDVGETVDGQPYLALEFVEGQHITAYAAAKAMDVRARVKLFRSVASAVAYAHRNLIVHRDLKPSNVLVDENGIAKVIDFGIAKPLMSQLGEAEVQATQTEQRIFSPHAAAPEQLRGDLVTPACDIYGLGALLYELLTSRPVFDLVGKNGLEIERTILEQDPLAPSTALARAGQTGRDLDADLDAITLVCLRKRPEDRYTSVEKLIEDLDAWLDDRPVAARNGNAWYRMRRFVRRHRRSLVVAALLLVVVSSAASLVTDAYRESSAQAVRADQFAKMLIGAISSADPGRKSGVDMSARDLFRSLAQTILIAPDISAKDRQELQLTLADIQLRLGDTQAAGKLLDATPEPRLSDWDNYFRFHSRRAGLLRQTGKFEEAGKVYDLLLSHAKGEQRADIMLHQLRMRYEAGEDLGLLPALEALAEPRLPRELEVARLSTMADIYRITGSYDRSIELFEKAFRMAEGLYPEGLGSQVRFQVNLFSLARFQASKERAEAVLAAMKNMVETHYEPGSLPMVSYLSMAQTMASWKGDTQESLRLQREVVETLSTRLPADSPMLINETFDLAGVEHVAGNRGTAYKLFESAIGAADRVYPGTHPNRLLFRVAYGVTLAQDDNLIASSQWTAPIVQDAEANPDIKKWDVYPIAVALKSGGNYAREQTSANRARFIQDFEHARDAAESIETKEVIERLAETLRSRGFELEPAAADTAAAADSPGT